MAESAHILVVEDDAFVQKALRLYLEGEGYRISTCDNGADMHKLIDSAHAVTRLYHLDIEENG